ncbi:aldehyde dehydrogenase family protein [Rhodococcus pseudokoreensis]|uniref:Aldehyde dehydrogenase family protein n=1 Tax=Rhodococcus pseudokoreensis TaxID=2811421 RepID=A0A974ZRV4_9NOCA|nr:aldehyde dehydrogenase family protein [Rhodococcus pseudokoreensis]QSE88136.1 aldehyde dehydrogenase family protein [Rhodococcus pseudokoreensis]
MTTPAQLHHLVDGQWLDGAGDILVSTSPAEPGVVVAQGRLADTAALDGAVASAQRAKREWARTPAHERGAILVRAAAVVENAAQDWGTELAREEGKTKPEGIGEVLRAAQILRYYGNDADRDAGEVFSSPRRGERIMVTRKPLGVVGVITPFNFPIAIPAWKIAPALTYGNTVVWKPTSTVPLLAMRLAQALTDAGLPDGVLNLVIGNGAVGNGIVEHPGIDAVTFTGSTGVGRRIAAAGAARGVPVQAEMGGKNAAVVLGDADLELAAEQVMLGAFRSTGQKCTATSRLIVTDDIAEDFLAELGKRADALNVGNPVHDGIEMGPVVDAAARSSIRAGIDRAFEQGAQRIAGGHDYSEGALTAGYFVPPTILELPSPSPDLWRDELFGPVLAVRRAGSVDEAFALVNDSEFGLSAAVFTQDLTRTLDAIDDLDVGILHINSESAGADPHVPFGGAKKSGYGPKEQGRSAREFFTHTTTVYLRGGQARI